MYGIHFISFIVDDIVNSERIKNTDVVIELFDSRNDEYFVGR